MALLGFLVPNVPYLALIALTLAIVGTIERDPGVLADAEPVPGGIGRGSGHRAHQLHRRTLPGSARPTRWAVIKDTTGSVSLGLWLVAAFEALTVL